VRRDRRTSFILKGTRASRTSPQSIRACAGAPRWVQAVVAAWAARGRSVVVSQRCYPFSPCRPNRRVALRPTRIWWRYPSTWWAS
jgi:hypothetical protein